MSKLVQIFSSRRTWAWPYILFLGLFVVLPLILVGVYAFTDIDGNFTLRNFAKFFTHSEAIQTFFYSLMIAVFNTAMIYELAVIRQQAEPLLEQVPENCEEYAEAYRLRKFLRYFVPIDYQHMPHNSLLREFFGGSLFDY